jgi:hypothetical protein
MSLQGLGLSRVHQNFVDASHQEKHKQRREEHKKTQSGEQGKDRGWPLYPKASTTATASKGLEEASKELEPRSFEFRKGIRTYNSGFALTSFKNGEGQHLDHRAGIRAHQIIGKIPSG